MKVTDLHLSWRISSQFLQADLGGEVNMQQTTKFDIHSRLPSVLARRIATFDFRVKTIPSTSPINGYYYQIPLKQTNSNQQLLAQQSGDGYGSKQSAIWQQSETSPQVSYYSKDLRLRVTKSYQTPVKLHTGGVAEVTKRSGVYLQVSSHKCVFI
jgi:hypothetical protein